MDFCYTPNTSPWLSCQQRSVLQFTNITALCWTLIYCISSVENWYFIGGLHNSHCLWLYILLKFPLRLTQDILVMLWYEGSPVLFVRFLDINVDKTIARSIQVGTESEYSSLVGHIWVLGFKVVHKFDPWQQACRGRLIKVQILLIIVIIKDASWHVFYLSLTTENCNHLNL